MYYYEALWACNNGRSIICIFNGRVPTGRSTICMYMYGRVTKGKGTLCTFMAVPGLGQMRPSASQVMRPLTWVLKEVDPVGLHGMHYQLYHYNIWSRSETERLQISNCTTLAKINRRNSFWQEDGPSWPTGPCA